MPRKNLMPPDPVESLAKRIHDEATKALKATNVHGDPVPWSELRDFPKTKYRLMAKALLDDPPRELTGDLHGKLLSAAERIHKQSELLSKKAEKK